MCVRCAPHWRLLCRSAGLRTAHRHSAPELPPAPHRRAQEGHMWGHMVLPLTACIGSSRSSRQFALGVKRNAADRAGGYCVGCAAHYPQRERQQGTGGLRCRAVRAPEDM